MKRILLILCAGLVLMSCGPKDGDYTIHVLATNDVHSSWFDSTYVGTNIHRSLFAVNTYVDSIRAAEGVDKVILLDQGDCLQGDNASYYFNYVDTLSPHIFPRLMDYMSYDAVTVGNHDIETGHPVYDKVCAELDEFGIPFLAGNAIRTDNGEPYFPAYTILKRQGLKIAVLGYTNPNMKAWLGENLWYGMDFKSLIPLVQEDVDEVIAKEKPEVVIVSLHSGTGKGDGAILENQGLDLFNSLKGVDMILCSHDHSPLTLNNGNISLINAGSKCSHLGHGVISVSIKDGKVVNKKTEKAELIPIDRYNVDEKMKAHFQKEYEAVKAFTLKEVGTLEKDINLSESFIGMSDYVNLLHTVSLSAEPAQISFAAPLSQSGIIEAGTLLFNDMFKLYRFENQLYVVKMKGKEIKDYLEYSYDMWINTISSPNQHVLNIVNRADPRSGTSRWSFANPSYNFDSAGGINYTVDVSKKRGERINISSMADGTAFDFDATYNVAMTSYRASGGGNLLENGAGVDTDRIEERVVAKYPEIRDRIYQYLKDNGSINPEKIGDQTVIGSWRFVPERLAGPALKKDYELMFN